MASNDVIQHSYIILHNFVNFRIKKKKGKKNPAVWLRKKIKSTRSILSKYNRQDNKKIKRFTSRTKNQKENLLSKFQKNIFKKEKAKRCFKAGY